VENVDLKNKKQV